MICVLLLVLSRLRFLPEDRLYLLLHEGPGDGGALQGAPLSTGTESLAALFDNGVPAASKAELVSDVTGTLYEVSVLQLPAAVRALEERGPHLVTAVAGAGHLVRPGPGGGRPGGSGLSCHGVCRRRSCCGQAWSYSCHLHFLHRRSSLVETSRQRENLSSSGARSGGGPGGSGPTHELQTVQRCGGHRSGCGNSLAGEA